MKKLVKVWKVPACKDCLFLDLLKNGHKCIATDWERELKNLDIRPNWCPLPALVVGVDSEEELEFSEVGAWELEQALNKRKDSK